MYASLDSGVTMAGKEKFGARTSKNKFGARVVNTNWATGSLNTNWGPGLGAIARAGGQAEGRRPGNTNSCPLKIFGYRDHYYLYLYNPLTFIKT